MDESGKFWTLERVSISLQLALVAVVIVILVVTMFLMAGQAQGFASVAEERAVEAERAATRTRKTLETLTCILVIPAEHRNTEAVQACGSLLVIPEPAPESP